MNTPKFKYSDNEILLIKTLGAEKLLAECTPPEIYRMLAHTAFCNNLQGTEIEILRSINKAIFLQGINRNSEQFEALFKT